MPTETFAIDYVSAAYYFTSESAQGREIRQRTGVVPSRDRPKVWLGVHCHCVNSSVFPTCWSGPSGTHLERTSTGLPMIS